MEGRRTDGKENEYSCEESQIGLKTGPPGLLIDVRNTITLSLIILRQSPGKRVLLHQSNRP